MSVLVPMVHSVPLSCPRVLSPMFVDSFKNKCKATTVDLRWSTIIINLNQQPVAVSEPDDVVNK